MTERILYSYRSEGITLQEAIQNCPELFTKGIALLYSPEYCKLAKIQVIEDKINLTNVSNESINLEYTSSHIFEARIFNPTCELRWLNTSNGKGQAVLISEDSENIPNFFNKMPEQAFLKILNQQYLLWGEIGKTQPIPGWRRLATSRIGSLDIPFDKPTSQNQRVYLKTIEYINTIDCHGNVAVIEERLVELSLNGVKNND